MRCESGPCMRGCLLYPYLKESFITANQKSCSFLSVFDKQRMLSAHAQNKHIIQNVETNLKFKFEKLIIIIKNKKKFLKIFYSK